MLENPTGGGGLKAMEILMREEAQAVLEFQVEGGGGSKKRAFRREGVDFFLTNAVINQ